jgi:hypothetical protein
MFVVVLPLPLKICKVFEAEILSLDFGMDSGLKAKARLVAGLGVFSTFSISAVSRISKVIVPLTNPEGKFLLMSSKRLRRSSEII